MPDDTLRHTVACTVQDHRLTTPVQCTCKWRETDSDDDVWAERVADALLPLIREHTERVERAERERHKLTTDTLRSYAEARSQSTSEAVRLTVEGVLQILDREATHG